MIKINGSIPNTIGVAVSGGPDSMAVLDFLLRGRRTVTAIHFDHGTEHGSHAAEFVTNFCKEKNINLIMKKADRTKNKGESPEEFWRNMRYDFFSEINIPIVTCHNLDDQVEQWIMTALHGEPRLIPISNKNVIRPFMTTTKAELISWCNKKSVPYLVDPSNSSSKYMRSFVRTNIVPNALHVNPGLYKVVKKKVESLYF